MTVSILLLVFLFVLAVGIGIILYISKNTTHFNLMTGWSLFTYLLFALIILICIIPAG